MDYPAQNSHVPNMVPTQAYLSTLSRQDRRRVLGQYLYPMVNMMYPNFMPHKITEILLDINSITGLISMISDPIYFQAKLKEAVTVLEVFYSTTCGSNVGYYPGPSGIQ